MTELERLERELHERLREINERAKLEAAPILAKLAELEALRPMAPIVLHTCLKCGSLCSPGIACFRCTL